MIAINKHSVKPKNWCFKMPNAPYLERQQFPLPKKDKKMKMNVENYK